MLTPRTRSDLIDTAVRVFFTALTAEQQGDQTRVAMARAGLLRIASEIGPTFTPMLIGATAIKVVQRPKARATFEDAQHIVEYTLQRICPELRVRPAHQEGHA